MANQNDTVSADRQQLTGDPDLIAREILDFSDLRNADGQPNHMLRWAFAVANSSLSFWRKVSALPRRARSSVSARPIVFITLATSRR